MVQIIPSILAADFTRLGDQVRAVERAGAKMIHVDIMDGHFVPNLTMGPPITESLRKATDIKLDHHLMIEDPDTYAPAFIKAGASSVSVHYEACRNLDRTLNMIRGEGAKAGVVINPHSVVDLLEDVLDVVDYVLIMSVNPGFGGQKFIASQLKKIEAIANRIAKENLKVDVEVDGGIDAETAKQAVSAGATVLVAGTAAFRSGPSSYAANIKALRAGG